MGKSEQELRAEQIMKAAEEANALTKLGDRPLPQFLDPASVMWTVQQYVELERKRTRKILLWASVIFVAGAILVLTVFISVGIYVLRNSLRASQIADKALSEATVYTTEIVGLSNKISRIEAGGRDIRKLVENGDARIAQRNRMLRSDLDRFSKWVEENSAKGLTAVSQVDATLASMEKSSAEKERELSEIKERYAGMLAAISSLSNRLAMLAVQAPAVAVENIQPVPPTEAAADTRSVVASTGKATDIFAPALAEVEKTHVPEAPEGLRHISEVSFPDGDKYKGEFKDGLFCGWGIYTSRKGDRYEGEFSENMKNGKGTLLYSNGDKYVGQFTNDMREGRGTMLLVNGDKYEGEFKSNMIGGKGTMFYHEGNRYAGDFKNGLKNGNGILSFANGDLYRGEFKDDMRDGQGTYIFTDGSRYVGGFKNGQRQGNGRYIYPDGEEYIGEFKDGKKDGHGVCVYPDGTRVNVVWKNDKMIEDER